ncbi:putative quinol monooxygenase [Streptomyces sp. H10-C2]|uniref:putative quinol monooxygenase n=1 Tax=unclassified Streptomyces TaxID=2593676 RepID=UPI0024B960BB|nr:MULTISPECIES: putative quinol monooxygenase [unclassified Streptomyces]MDJ0344427.1 putative quinol monooxygenase [Streptomyces sp. PH10-H1]MDJ0372097.1 putative quinol monooxygenase [Streptomyces sp. H10-C2]
MYHIAVSFDVPAEHREEFIAAALEDGRNSGRDEHGTRRFELIADADNPGCFYLNEAYDDEAAFDAHCKGEHFAKFFAITEKFAKGPVWLIKGTRIEDPTTSIDNNA